MDAVNVRTLVILTGPRGADLDRLVAALVKPHPGRFVVFTQVDWSKADEPGFGRKAAAQLRDSVARGARGLKVLKELGLYVRDRQGASWWPSTIRAGIRSGPSAGGCGIPVAIHSGDPEAFFHPDRRQERALRGAVGQPRLELPRPRLPPAAGAAGGAGPRVRPPPAHHLRGPALRRLAREPGPRLGAAEEATPTSTSRPAPARPSWAASPGARAGSSSSTRTASCSAPTCGRARPLRQLLPLAARPPTSTSPTTTTPPRAAGTSTASSCPTRCWRRSTTATPIAPCVSAGPALTAGSAAGGRRCLAARVAAGGLARGQETRPREPG